MQGLLYFARRVVLTGVYFFRKGAYDYGYAGDTYIKRIVQVPFQRGIYLLLTCKNKQKNQVQIIPPSVLAI